MKTPPHYATPQEAEGAFYSAFERMDLEAMMEVWAADDTIVCIHPMGAALRGREQIESSWRAIFRGSTSMRFKITHPTYVGDDRIAVHSLEENISYGKKLTRQARVIATNIYRLTDNGWRMIVHHASPGTEEGTTESPASVLH